MDASDSPILTTERLRLRPLAESDLDDYAAMHADPEVVRHLGVDSAPWDRGRSWRQLAFHLGHWRLGGTGLWAVELRTTGEFLGTIGFAEPEGWPGCELAWALARPFWGQGYATEGARAALAHAFEILGRDRVISLIKPGNNASIRVAERIGQCLEGSVTYILGERLCYAIDRETFAAQAAAAPAPRLADLLELVGGAKRYLEPGTSLHQFRLPQDMGPPTDESDRLVPIIDLHPRWLKEERCQSRVEPLSLQVRRPHDPDIA